MTRQAPAAYEAVCFDVGEVLIDETRVWSVWARLVGTTPFTLHALIGAAIARGGQHTDALDEFPGWRDREDEHEAALAGLQREDLYPDAVPALRTLRDAGVFVAIAGNQPARRTPQLLAAGLSADVVVTSDELEAEKPAARFFELLFDRLPVADPGRVLYVGDRVDNDIVPAAAAGWATALLLRGPWARLQPRTDVAPTHEIASLDGLTDLVLPTGAV